MSTKPLAYLWQLTADGQIQARQLVFEELTAEGLVAAYGGTVTPLYATPPSVTAEQFHDLACAALQTDDKSTGYWHGVGAALEAVRGEPVAFRLLRKSDRGWVNDGRYWVEGAPDTALLDDVANRSDQWMIQYAYATPPAYAFSEPVAEMVYFKRKGSGVEDCIPVPLGAANLHVGHVLITRRSPLYLAVPN